MNEIQSAAASVAALEAAAHIAAEELAASHRHADAIRDRRVALVTERDAMAAARRADNDVDGARLALINLDIEGLDALLADAAAAVAAAQAKADHARAAADTARQHLARVTDADLLAQLSGHADKLGGLLLATITEIAATESRLGHSRPAYFPAGALADRIHRLDLIAAGIPGARR